MLHQLSAAAARADLLVNAVGIRSVVAAERAGRKCDASGWPDRPAWVDLAAGVRPPEPEPDFDSVGEWMHGWQHHSAQNLEKESFNLLLRDTALPSTRSNAAAPGKARLFSCCGRFASVWLTVCPTTELLAFENCNLQVAVRRRLGLAICHEGADTHGHAALTTNIGGRLNAKHTALLTAWRQVFLEAGGQVPQRNVERMLRNTHIPVPTVDQRRLDLVVPGLNVARGLPLFCDVTVVTPLTAAGQARPGTSNRGGSLLEAAQRENDATYSEVTRSGLGALFCLGSEVFGRWGSQSVDLVPALARERVRGLHVRVRRGTRLLLERRWWGILGVSQQRGIAHILRHQAGADLVRTQLEPATALADLA